MLHILAKVLFKRTVLIYIPINNKDDCISHTPTDPGCWFFLVSHWIGKNCILIYISLGVIISFLDYLQFVLCLSKLLAHFYTEAVFFLF